MSHRIAPVLGSQFRGDAPQFIGADLIGIAIQNLVTKHHAQADAKFDPRLHRVDALTEGIEGRAQLTFDIQLDKVRAQAQGMVDNGLGNSGV